MPSQGMIFLHTKTGLQMQIGFCIKDPLPAWIKPAGEWGYDVLDQIPVMAANTLTSIFWMPFFIARPSSMSTSVKPPS